MSPLELDILNYVLEHPIPKHLDDCEFTNNAGECNCGFAEYQRNLYRLRVIGGPVSTNVEIEVLQKGIEHYQAEIVRLIEVIQQMTSLSSERAKMEELLDRAKYMNGKILYFKIESREKIDDYIMAHLELHNKYEAAQSMILELTDRNAKQTKIIEDLKANNQELIDARTV